uniref:Reverse transcriptase domain-containing protein n=1 Tax=Tanacetum cinerariifolium TaxID=118510 RepID=A0A699IQP2_TANCI|nr:reverse transcriptase domain-containing protein [Tanacetum cinerariifolium]
MSESNREDRPYAEKVQQEKVQQEKLKEVKARLDFEGYSVKNSKIQKVSQHFESSTPNIRRDHERNRRSRRSCSMSRSPEPTSVFSRIRRGRSGSPKHGLGDKVRKEGGVFNRLREHPHEVRRCSQKVKTVEEDTRSQSRKNQSQVLKKTTYHNHGQCRHGATCSIPHSLDSLGERWQLPTKHRRKHFWHGSNKKLGENKILTEGETLGISRDQSGDVTSSHSLKKSPKEILALNKAKFKTPPPMTTPVEKRINKRFCEYHEEVGHNTDECMHLKRICTVQSLRNGDTVGELDMIRGKGFGRQEKLKLPIQILGYHLVPSTLSSSPPLRFWLIRNIVMDVEFDFVGKDNDGLGYGLDRSTNLWVNGRDILRDIFGHNLLHEVTHRRVILHVDL